MKSILLALAAAGVVASGSAAAGTTIAVTHHSAPFARVQYSDRWDDRSGTINERESRIRNRIERGLQDGRITNREARRLYRQLSAIEAKEHAFKSDGRLNRREDAELNRDLDRLASNVRQQMRDEQRRY
jgi:hypothetical protein